MKSKRDMLLVILNGKKDIFIEKLGAISNTLQVKKIDDKVLSEFKYLTKFIKETKKEEVWFCTIQNDLQRFHFFILFYIFRTTRKGGLIDENGNKVKYSFGKLFGQLPLFIIEAFSSSFVLLFYNIKISLDKWILKN